MSDDTGHDIDPARRRDGNGFVLFLLVIAGIAGLVGWGALRRADPPEPLAIPDILTDEDLEADLADGSDEIEPVPVATAGADIGVTADGSATRDASIGTDKPADEEAAQADVPEETASADATDTVTDTEDAGEAEVAAADETPGSSAVPEPEATEAQPPTVDETEVVLSARPATDVEPASDDTGNADVAQAPIAGEGASETQADNTTEAEESDTLVATSQSDTVPEALPRPVETAVTTPVEDAVPNQTVPDASAPPTTTAGNPDSPTFDLVRIDVSGGGLVAGRAAPGTTVRVLVDGQEIATAEASAKGEFVAFVQTPARNEGQLLSLAALGAAGEVIDSEEQILLLPAAEQVEEDVDIAPAVLKAEPDGVRVMQPPGQPKIDNVSLDVITYDEDGQVLLSGRAPRAQTIRIYVDQQPVIDVESLSDGTWETHLPGVEEGRYVLRVDALNEDGTVSSRVESPFQRVYPTAEQRKLGQVTVQPGHTLWVLAQERYGSGFQYTQIFAANRGLIRDPDLIYPGQIFELPDQAQAGQ